MSAAVRAVLWSLLALATSGCRYVPVAVASLPPVEAPVRFLLTFDDGPSIATDDNPTLSILRQLADNDTQPGIKAVFFVQTRHVNGGGTTEGRALIRHMHAQGHLIALHTAEPRHTSHARMSDEDLDQSLARGKQDLAELLGETPTLVRPPFWSYTTATERRYRAAGLRMLLADIKARDGVIYVFPATFDLRRYVRHELLGVREQLAAGRLPASRGAIPVVIGMHDINRFTASHLREYLSLLVEEARYLGIPLTGKPFYDGLDELNQAALARTTAPDTDLPALTLK
jgi:peptidoglycan/xylan/chitin deacetylase (PgdA/CDA1 family)